MVFAEFVEEQRGRLSSSTYRQYHEIIELLGMCLNGYGHQYLPREATDLAQVGWAVNIVLGRSRGTWFVLEAVNVYP